MTPEQELKIVTATLKYILQKNNVRLTENTRRGIVNMAEAIGASIEDVMEVIDPLVR